MAILMALITSMGGPLNTAMQATGDIKLFQIVVSIIMCCDIPLAYYFLTLGVEPYLVTGVSIFTSILCLFAKLIILKRQIKYNLWNFIVTVVCKNVLVAAVIFILFNFLSAYIPSSFAGFLLLCILSVVLNGAIIYTLGFDSSERKLIGSMMKSMIKKVSN